MSKNLKGKNAFTSLRINRAAEEEIKKYNNNGIHFAYSASKDSNNKNNKISRNINQKKYSNGSSELNNNNTNYQTKNINISPKKIDKNDNEIIQSHTDYKIKPKSKINKSGIVINIYSRKQDKDFISINDENENQTEKEDYQNLRNNFEIDENDAINIVRNMWSKNNQISKETNVDFYCEKIDNSNKNKIIKETNFNFISNKSKNKHKNKFIKENGIFFTLYKTGLKINKFLYTSSNYIRDLSNSIFLQKEKENELLIINPPNNESITKLKYTQINPKSHNELESDLNNYYIQNKTGYYTNIDNNDDIEEQKLKPIYVLNKPQICLLYNELYPQKEEEKISEEKKEGWGIGKNILSISKQVGIDYEIIEVFTPRLNKDNNTNRNSSNINNNIISNNIKEVNNINNNYVNSNINSNNNKEFGQVTPLSMLNDKFLNYALSRNIKFSIPENQGFISYLNYDKYIKNNLDKVYQLQKNKFSLKIVHSTNKNEKNNININNKRKNNNIIDYSKYSSGSEKIPKNK